MIEGLWEKANQVSEVGCRLDGIAGIVELLAERLTDNAESGACWTVAEVLRMHGEKLERLSEDIMAIQRIESDKPKGKKK